MTDLIAELGAIVGVSNVLAGESLLSQDAGTYPESLHAYAMARPSTTDEVSRILKLCNKRGQVVVTQGGRTSYAEGTITTSKDIILSLERLNEIEHVDIESHTITVQAGATLESVQLAAENVGLFYPIDLGSRGNCTIGGNISTNAGGNQVVSYGMTRAWVLGLEVVLADGTIISSLNKLSKNTAGYDIKQLFIGAEGTLGVVVRAVLQLTAPPRSIESSLLTTNTYDNLLRLLKFIKTRLGSSLGGFEVMWNEYYEQGADCLNGKIPLPKGHAYYIIAEGFDTSSDNFSELLDEAMSLGFINDGVIAESLAQRAAFWSIREDGSYVFYDRYPGIISYDSSLPINRIGDYHKIVKRQIGELYPDMLTIFMGHVANGNLHPMIFSPQEIDKATRLQIDKIMYEPLRDMGGSISGELGVGREKKAFLAYCRTNEEIALMRSIKQLLDSKNILNPQNIF